MNMSLAHPPNLGIILIHKNKVVAVIPIFSTFQNWNEVASISVNRADYLRKETIWKIFPHNRVIDPLSLVVFDRAISTLIKVLTHLK